RRARSDLPGILAVARGAHATRGNRARSRDHAAPRRDARRAHRGHERDRPGLDVPSAAPRRDAENRRPHHPLAAEKPEPRGARRVMNSAASHLIRRVLGWQAAFTLFVSVLVTALAPQFLLLRGSLAVEGATAVGLGVLAGG